VRWPPASSTGRNLPSLSITWVRYRNRVTTPGGRYSTRQLHRPSFGRAAGLVLLTWGVAVAFTLFVAADTRIGPVVWRFTATHGVHVGDIYATLGTAAIAILVTVWIVMDYTGRQRRYERAVRQARRARQRAAVEDEPEYAESGHAEQGHDDQGYDDHGYDDEDDDREYDDQAYDEPGYDDGVDDQAYDDRAHHGGGRHARIPDPVHDQATVILEGPLYQHRARD